ncbi:MULTISPECIES: DUF6204 family protein [Streptomyces]|uniref:Uncharacterized protein n=1 Tax=Streptomyces cacaoi TaxID=1898 RepID=A0A4Y3QST0_STRCI|nr:MULTISPECIES: DUF6204 family protein [Streptomyces]NNG86954.1 hypothetical protein [Streptomyces cacaoi]QHF94896.1 hypothetical protein DEH18_14710 [Streptomyces sp. NHF165]GEB48262.1 hypothetical protein SCA03_08130 [Streptomyces cacaoi]
MFRVTIRGAFGPLDDAGRAALRAGTDGAVPGYTEAGSFTCDAGLSSFTFRCQVAPPPPGQEEDEEGWATLRALEALEAHGHPHRVLRVGVTDMRAIKIRRKGGAGQRAERRAR